MYEYKCSNEECEHIWSIREGSIGSMYLTCPVCKKGRGQFIRQVKNDAIHEDIQRISVKNAEDDFIEPLVDIIEAEKEIQDKAEELQEKKPKTRARKKKAQEDEVKTEKHVEAKMDEKPKKKASKKDEKHTEINASLKDEKQAETKVLPKDEKKAHDKAAKKDEKKAETRAPGIKAVEEAEEEDIFTRIIKKREREAKLKQGDDENTDILEVSGNTLEEIDNRIKEFEEYYYIKVLDKNVQKQGKRYNCIIKYCRK